MDCSSGSYCLGWGDPSGTFRQSWLAQTPVYCYSHKLSFMLLYGSLLTKMPFKCENMQNKHISGLSISVLPFSSLCFDSSLLVSFLTFGLFWMGCALKDGENYFYFWHQQHPKHSDLETVPFPNKEEKLGGRGNTK